MWDKWSMLLHFQNYWNFTFCYFFEWSPGGMIYLHLNFHYHICHWNLNVSYKVGSWMNPEIENKEKEKRSRARDATLARTWGAATPASSPLRDATSAWLTLAPTPARSRQARPAASSRPEAVPHLSRQHKQIHYFFIKLALLSYFSNLNWINYDF